MRQHHQHHHIALAENDFGNTIVCTDCGTITLNLPQVSLRLDGPAFQALHALLQQAQANLALLSVTHPGHPAFSGAQTSPSGSGLKSQVH